MYIAFANCMWFVNFDKNFTCINLLKPILFSPFLGTFWHCFGIFLSLHGTLSMETKCFVFPMKKFVISETSLHGFIKGNLRSKKS